MSTVACSLFKSPVTTYSIMISVLEKRKQPGGRKAPLGAPHPVSGGLCALPPVLVPSSIPAADSAFSLLLGRDGSWQSLGLWTHCLRPPPALLAALSSVHRQFVPLLQILPSSLHQTDFSLLDLAALPSHCTVCPQTFSAKLGSMFYAISPSSVWEPFPSDSPPPISC